MTESKKNGSAQEMTGTDEAGVSGNSVQYFIHKRDFFSFAGIQGTQIGQVRAGYLSLAVGGSFQSAIMDHHKFIFYGKNIQFNPRRSH